MSITIIKWISLPVLLTGSLFARFAGSYEIVLNLLVCAGALVVVQRAISFREYLRAAAFVGVAIVFSPLTLIIKIFLLSLTCIGALAGVYAAWKPQPLESL
jgi:disulfide bond formation protein DsbB